MSWHISGGYLISLICLRRSLMPRSYCESLHVTCGPVPLSTSSGSRQLSQGNSSCWHPKRPPQCDWKPHQGPPRMNEKQKWDKGVSCSVLVFQIQNAERKMRITSNNVHCHQNQLRQLWKKSAWGWSLRFQHTSLKDIKGGIRKNHAMNRAMIGTPSSSSPRYHFDEVHVQGSWIPPPEFLPQKKSSQSTSIREKKHVQRTNHLEKKQKV